MLFRSLTVKEKLQAVGLRQYEISNFAKPGKESAHNINYWRCGDYIGLGVGAHSHKNGRRFWNTSNLFDYIQKLGSGGSGEEASETLSGHQRLVEAILFGLRTREGVDVLELENRFENKLDNEKKDTIKRFISDGFLFLDKNRLTSTEKGQLVLDELSVRLI